MVESYYGEIRMWAGSYAPDGWAFCDGRLLQISENTGLYAAIGTMYGGDGLTTFALPDLSGRLPMGFGSAPGLTPRTLMGQKVGQELVDPGAAGMPEHNHTFSVTAASATTNSPISATNALALASPTNDYSYYLAGEGTPLSLADDLLTRPTGGAHTNLMPCLAVNFIICITGLFPTTAVPVLNGVSPNTGTPQGGARVTLGGLFYGSSPSVSFGSTPATVISASYQQIVVQAPSGTGRVPIYVSSAGSTSEASAGTLYTYVPSIFSVEPSHGRRVGGTSVKISGAGLKTAKAVNFGANAVTSFASVDDGAIVLTSPGGTGVVDVTVTLADGTVSTPASGNQFSYAPEVLDVSPRFGSPLGGTAVTVTGFDFEQGVTVMFGPSPGKAPTVASDTSLTVTSPAGTGIVPVSVVGQGSGKVPVTRDFSYLPVVRGISPDSGLPGTQVTITGENFVGIKSVQFGTVSATPVSATETSITVQVPAAKGVVSISVTGVGGTSQGRDAPRFSYVPTLTYPDPMHGPIAGNTPVTIKGTNFTPAATVRFGKNPAKVTYQSSTVLTAISPACAGDTTVDLFVTTEYGTNEAKGWSRFIYNLGVTSVTPAHGVAGDTVTIHGAGFASGAVVKFGASQASGVTVTPDGTQLTCTVPTGSGQVTVTVTVAGATSMAGQGSAFSYVPAVTKLAPASGTNAGGTPVTITGNGFVTGAGNTSVYFGAVAATNVSVSSSTSLTAVTPAGSGEMPVTVETANGTSLTTGAPAYTYTPSVFSVRPSHGDVLGGTLVTITGIGLTGATAVAFRDANGVGHPAKSVVAVSDTKVTCLSPAGSDACHVIVTAPAGTTVAYEGDLFHYAPSVSAVSPGGGPAKGGTTVTLTGSGFQDVEEIWFGGYPTTSFTVASSTQITVTSPAGEGTGPVIVRTKHGSSWSSDQNQYGYSPVIHWVSASQRPVRKGTQVAITGAGLESHIAGLRVTTTVIFNGTAQNTFRMEGRSLVGPAPTDLSGAVTVIVRTNWGDSDPYTWNV